MHSFADFTTGECESSVFTRGRDDFLLTVNPNSTACEGACTLQMTVMSYREEKPEGLESLV